MGEPTSTPDGASAVGGVLNSTTRRGPRPLGAPAAAGISSEGLTRYALSREMAAEAEASSGRVPCLVMKLITPPMALEP